MSHYDSYTHAELVARIEALERRQRANQLEVKELAEALIRADNMKLKYLRVIAGKDRVIAEKTKENDGLNDKLAAYVVADVLRSA